jgi:type I site-specific restriction endonuclease
VSAAMGTGKTTFTTAFIVAMVRLSDTHPNMPYGCLFLTDQIIKADAMYQELSQFLPKQVAIWTTDHAPACEEPTRVPRPAAKFSKEELQEYPVAIATHALFQRTDGAHPAR